MIKIVYIITGLATGGAEIMLYHLLAKINRQKFNPVVISLIDKGTLGDLIESLGISVYTLGMKRGIPTFTSVRQLIKTIGHLQPDLIQGWMYHGNLAAKLASIFSSRKIPVLWTIHHSINSLADEKRMTAAIIKFSALISQFTNQIAFVSQKSKIQHEALGYCDRNNCVIPNGFDTDLFQPSLQAKQTFRKELGLPESALLIGSISRFHPMKDHGNFLKAAALLLEKNSDIYFIMVGTNVDNNNSKLSELIQNLELVNQVHLLGERRDISLIMPSLDIVTSSSAYGEAFPLVIGEAMSCGVPCVVTDIGDSGWIVGETGKVIPPQNSEALAKAWQELIILTIEERKALGEMARERIINSFSLEFVVTKYENLYESCL